MPGTDPTVTITIGFTISDRENDYTSFTDGYRPGAKQDAIDITVPDLGLTPRAWAEAAFIATNAPAAEIILNDPGAPEIYAALHGRRIRSLSVGDTVTCAGTVLACTPVGWKPITPTPSFELGQLMCSPHALALIYRHGPDALATVEGLIDRHRRGDWGDVDEYDAEANRAAIRDGRRIRSAYRLACDLLHCSDDHRVWILTKADRTWTAILTPQEYR